MLHAHGLLVSGRPATNVPRTLCPMQGTGLAGQSQQAWQQGSSRMEGSEPSEGTQSEPGRAAPDSRPAGRGVHTEAMSHHNRQVAMLAGLRKHCSRARRKCNQQLSGEKTALDLSHGARTRSTMYSLSSDDVPSKSRTSQKRLPPVPSGSRFMAEK